jgi:hypothetical protein
VEGTTVVELHALSIAAAISAAIVDLDIGISVLGRETIGTALVKPALTN